MLISQHKQLFRPVKVSFPSTRTAIIVNKYHFLSLRCTFASLTSPALLTQLWYDDRHLPYSILPFSHTLLQMPLQICLNGEAILK
jgi:hypothetical protein